MKFRDDAYRLADLLLKELPYQPNGQQLEVAAALAEFCMPVGENDYPVFILNGYAGTGKTSLVAALSRALAATGVQTVLLAPTGRAAKVIAAQSGRTASTIHRRIYRHSLNGEVPSVRENRSRDTLFIVDEASMIPGADDAGNDLLADLIHYVYTGDNCRLLLMGDTAQLPPVGSDISPAMDRSVLRNFGLRVTKATLTAITRQRLDSGILYNATLLRKAMKAKIPEVPRFVVDKFPDVKFVEPAEIPDEIASAYDRLGTASVVVITRSNRDAAAYNRGIRSQVLFYEEEIVAGELLIVAKNNYYWTQKVKGLDFVANGDVVKVRRVLGTEKRFGYRFADVELEEPVSGKDFTAKIMLDTLTGEAAAMPGSDMSKLVENIKAEFINEEKTDTSSLIEAMEQYAGALQVKYAYAVTCHKAQGGQWTVVFVDSGYLPEGADAILYMRWLYTAVTRAVSKLYIISSDYGQF